MSMLDEMIADRTIGPVKVLMTSPGRNFWLQGRLTREQHVELSGGNSSSVGSERALRSAARAAILAVMIP